MKNDKKELTIDLQDLRKSIDLIDQSLVCLIAERMRLVQKVGKYKKAHDIQPLDKARWEQVLNSKIMLAKEHHLSSELIEKVYTVFHEYALQIEEES